MSFTKYFLKKISFWIFKKFIKDIEFILKSSPKKIYMQTHDYNNTPLLPFQKFICMT